MAVQIEPAVSVPLAAPIAKAGFSTRDRLNAWACEAPTAESEGSNILSPNHRDHHVHVIRQQMPLLDPASFCAANLRNSS
jgi:hypothetical protein